MKGRTYPRFRTRSRAGVWRSRTAFVRSSADRLTMSGGKVMSRRCGPCAVLCALLLIAGAAVAGAQQFTGGVRGLVRDPNGVIPGVTVTLTNEATNVSREVQTNDVGQYSFPAVPPGTYTLKTQLTGYKTYE